MEMSYMLEIIPVNQGTIRPPAITSEADTMHKVLEDLIAWVENEGDAFHIFPTKSKEAGIIKKHTIPRYHYFIWEM